MGCLGGFVSIQKNHQREDQVRDMLGDTLRYKQINQTIENSTILRRRQ
jgi:hypothetical protein